MSTQPRCSAFAEMFCRSICWAALNHPSQRTTQFEECLMGYSRGRTRRKKVRFNEIANRITGFSVPMFGVSWDPPTLEVEIARRLITEVTPPTLRFTAISDDYLVNIKSHRHYCTGKSQLITVCTRPTTVAYFNHLLPAKSLLSE